MDLETVKTVKSMRGVPDEGRKGLNKWKQDEEIRAGRNNGPTRTILIEVGTAGLGRHCLGGCGGESS